MENKEQNLEALDMEALKNVNGGTIQEAYEYLEELRKQYNVATWAQVRDMWTEEEQSKFNALLYLGYSDPHPKPQNPNIPVIND